jgi:hypothetical protein
VRAIVERFVNTRPSAPEAETMQSADGFLFAVAGLEDIGADESFINNPSLQLMVHTLIDPMRAEILLDAADAIEARRAGVATPFTPVHVGPDSQQDDDEDEEDEDDEEFGPVHWYHHAEEEEEEEEGFVDAGGIHGEEDEGEEDGDMDSPIANEEEVGVEGVVRKALQFDEEPSAKKTKFMAAQLNSLKKAMNDHQIEEADDPDVGEQNAAEQTDAEHNADMDEHCVAQPDVASTDEHH